MNKCILWVIVAVFAMQAAAEPHYTANELIDRYEKTQEKLQILRFDGVTSTKEHDSLTGNYVEVRSNSKFLTDGNRVNFQVEQRKSITSDNEPSQAEKRHKRVSVWDDSSYTHYRGSPGSTGIAFVFHDDNNKAKQISVEYGGAPLIGIFDSDTESIASILKDADDVSVRGELEEINGSANYVIDAQTPSGKYTIWLDPQFDFNITKAEVRKTKGDLAWGKQLEWVAESPKGFALSGWKTPVPKNEFYYLLSNVHFENINGVWVPIKGDYESILTYEDGRVITNHVHHETTHVDLNPDLDSRDAFVPDIPNGTKTILNIAQGLSYEWIDGKPTPSVNSEVIAAIDYNLDHFDNSGLTQQGGELDAESDLSIRPNMQLGASTNPNTWWFIIALLIVLTGGSLMIIKFWRAIRVDK